MLQRMRLVDEPKSGAIWWNYFLPPTLAGMLSIHSKRKKAGVADKN
jgi:hypothetical protein